jgi:GTPase
VTSISNNTLSETTILVGVSSYPQIAELTIDESLDELSRLAETAGLTVVGRITQRLHQIDSNTYIGSGKVEELKQLVDEYGAQTVIFDDELSPRHLRQLELALGVEVKLLDRSALILDIFAQHAHTKEGALQVELAQLEYRLPRLTRMWTHLARQSGGGSARGGSGGVGLRGPGETQLEVDKREITRKISKLKKNIDGIREQRELKRKLRTQNQIPVVAIVGYTNAGKSSLLRSLTGEDIYVADQLFATLDPLSRRVRLPSGRQVLFSDTVGFIQKLPTTLVAAFRSTLEEIRYADLILHIADSNHPQVLKHVEAVEDVLAEIDVAPITRILVWNKIDQLDNEVPTWTNKPSAYYPDNLNISARTGIGVDALLDLVDKVLLSQNLEVSFMIPYERGDILAQLFDNAVVKDQKYTETGVIIRTMILPSVYPLFSKYEWAE